MLIPSYGSRGSTPISDVGLGTSAGFYQPPTQPQPLTNDDSTTLDYQGTKVTVSECTLTIDYRPPLVGPQFPPIQFTIVNPKCREEPPPDPPPPPSDVSEPTFSNEPQGIPSSAQVKVFVSYSITENSLVTIGEFRESGYFSTQGIVDDVKCPGRPYQRINSFGNGFITVTSPSWMSGIGMTTQQLENNQDPSRNFTDNSQTPQLEYFEGQFESNLPVFENNIQIGTIKIHGQNISQNYGLSNPRLYTGQWGLIKKYIYNLLKGIIDSNTYSFSYPGNNGVQINDSGTASASCTFVKVFSASCVPYLPPPPPRPSRRPPPPPSPPPRRCCMGCCPSNVNNNNNDALLRQILVLLQKVDKHIGTPPFAVDIFDSDEEKPEAQKKTENIPTLVEGLKVGIREGQKQLKILGIDSFPIKAKANSVVPEKSGIWAKIFGFIDPEEKVDIRSIVDILLWQEKRRLGEMGQWMQTIEVADADLTKEGDQYKKVVLPNVAESLKEVVMQNALNARTQGLVLDVVLKILVEVCSTKMVSSQGTTILKDIQEYLDYTTQEKTFQVPIGISIPGKDLTAEDEADLAKFLEPSNQPFVSAEWDGKMSFSDTLLDILQAVSIIRAMGFKQS